MIEAYRRKYGHFPPWNKIGGSIKGQEKVTTNTINIVESFYHPDNYDIYPIVSRSTIRELSKNVEWGWYENYLHNVRMNMLMLGIGYEGALNFAKKNDVLNSFEEMRKSGYLKKHLVV